MVKPYHFDEAKHYLRTEGMHLWLFTDRALKDAGLPRFPRLPFLAERRFFEAIIQGGLTQDRATVERLLLQHGLSVPLESIPVILDTFRNFTLAGDEQDEDE